MPEAHQRSVPLQSAPIVAVETETQRRRRQRTRRNAPPLIDHLAITGDHQSAAVVHY
jgi:hypothetical protein